MNAINFIDYGPLSFTLLIEQLHFVALIKLCIGQVLVSSVTNLSEFFGDGLYYAGSVLIMLLDQRERFLSSTAVQTHCRDSFEAFDFSNHIIKAYFMDRKDSREHGFVRGL